MFQNVISYSFITKSFIHVSDRYNCKHLSIQNHRIITGQEEDIWPIILCWLSTKSSSYSTFCKALLICHYHLFISSHLEGQYGTFLHCVSSEF